MRSRDWCSHDFDLSFGESRRPYRPTSSSSGASGLRKCGLPRTRACARTSFIHDDTGPPAWADNLGDASEDEPRRARGVFGPGLVAAAEPAGLPRTTSLQAPVPDRPRSSCQAIPASPMAGRHAHGGRLFLASRAGSPSKNRARPGTRGGARARTGGTQESHCRLPRRPRDQAGRTRSHTGRCLGPAAQGRGFGSPDPLAQQA